MMKMEFQHKDLANGRWAQISLAEQMLNIGSEVSRANRWKAKGIGWSKDRENDFNNTESDLFDEFWLKEWY